MISCRDEIECYKLVTFYVIYTSIYFSFIVFSLFWFGGIYTVGQYNFQTILLIISFAEALKYFTSAACVIKSDFNLFQIPENVSFSAFVKGIFTMSRAKEGCKTIMVVFGMTVVYFAFSVLFGAEVFEKYEETFMLSALLSVLTILPVCINLGGYFVVSIILGFRPNDKLEHLMCQNLYITILGAWLGAYAIPLDWERAWQKWPISCSSGAMLGFLTSHILMVIHLRKTEYERKFKE